MAPIITKKYINEISYEIMGAAIEVHKILGPGLLERNYEEAFVYELRLRNLQVQTQQAVRVPYKDIIIDCEMRYDVLVEDLIIVENKAVLDLHPIFTATLLSYMKHLKKPKGFIINYYVSNIFKDGQKTYVNEYFANLPEE